jgi:hypothetical protein
MEEIGHWINGKRVAGTSGRFADVWNPATGEVQAKVPLASKAELTPPSPMPPPRSPPGPRPTRSAARG